MRRIFLDTETTGLDPRQGHRVIELGCIEMHERRRTGGKLHFYFNPDRAVDPGALEVHGLSNDFLADKPRFAEKLNEFLDFVKGAEVIAHNASFDVGFLDAEFERQGLGKFSSHVAQVTDTLQMARELFPGQRNSLDALCNRLGVNNSHRTLHGALLDSEILSEVYLAMTRGQDSLMMDVGNGADQTGQGGRLDLSTLDLPLVNIAPDDMAAHEAYLQGLDKEVKGACIWRRYSAQA
jgi:DNA polymerase-3 subunit epsilon